MVIQRERHTGRTLIDGKIEDLWLKDEAETFHLKTVYTLGRLMEYVQSFCAEHTDIAHFSSVLTANHPPWMREFFTLVGFKPCEHLKPETVSKSYRACLDLTPPAAVEKQQPSKLTPTVLSKKDKEELKSCGPSTTSHQGQEKAAESSKTVSAVPKGPSRKATISGSPKIPRDDHAEDWLSQNKQILSSNATPTSAKPQAHASKISLSMSNDSPAKATDASEGSDAVGGKRKRSLTEYIEHRNGVEKERNVRGLDVAEKERNIRGASNQNTFGADKERSIRGQPDHLTNGTSAPSPNTKDDEQQRRPNTKPPPSQPSFTARRLEDLARDLRAKEAEKAALNDAIEASEARKSGAKSVQAMREIKEEYRPAPLLSEHRSLSPRPEPHLSYSSKNLPMKELTCFYWMTSGYCKKSDAECSYAHYDTGKLARPPRNFRGPNVYGVPLPEGW